MKIYIVYLFFPLLLLVSCSPDVTEEQTIDYVDQHGIPSNIYDIYINKVSSSKLIKGEYYEFISMRRASYIKYKWYIYDQTVCDFKPNYSGLPSTTDANTFIKFNKKGTYKVYLELLNHDGSNTSQKTVLEKEVTVE